MLKILIVDDEYYCRFVVEEMLKKFLGCPFVIETAGDGITALDKYESFHPDLVFLDYKLPDINGLDVYSKIRGLDPFNNTFVFFLSGMDRDILNVEDSEGCTFIQKPFQIKHFQKLINRYLLTAV